jgi:RNA 2',3'-cyclic 3'-phosphodiesterase
MRLFVGVSLPGDVKDELSSFIERIRPSAPDAIWVPRDNLHCTIAFLGEVSESRIPGIGTAVADAAASVSGPIPTAATGAGAFPSARRARVIWAGLDPGDGRLGGLARAVDAALEPIGFAPGSRAWTPHVTLARLRKPAAVPFVVADTPQPVAFSIVEATLFRSRLGRPAPVYEPLERFPLGR